VVIGLFRDAYYAQREQEPKDRDKRLEWLRRKASMEIELLALKVREGAPGTEKLFAHVAHNAIRDDELPPLGGLEGPAGPLFDTEDLIA